MPTPNLSYIDGLQSVVDISVFCYNNGQTYVTYDGDPSEGAVQTETRDSDNRLIGSVTFNDARKGTINCSYTLAADEAPGAVNMIHPSYIINFRQRVYVVGAVKTPVRKGETIKFSFEVTELQNPFFPELLSIDGQQLKDDIAASTPVTLSLVAFNVRTGAVLTYSVESFAAPGTAAPAGISINATTGLLTTNVAAGTYDVRVIAKDDIGDDVPLYGQGRYTPTAA